MIVIQQPSGFVVNVDANGSAVYYLKFEGKVIKSGKEGEMLLIVDREVEITAIYLDGLEEVEKKFKVMVKAGYLCSCTVRIRAYPAYTKV